MLISPWASHIFIYRDIILSDSSHHTSLRPFPMAADSAASAVIQVYRESGSMCSFQCIVVNIRFILIGAENVFLRLTDEWSIYETHCSLHVGISLVKASRREINSDSSKKK
jgi:hypothetical protein